MCQGQQSVAEAVGEQTVAADAHESFGQHVKEEAAEEVLGCEECLRWQTHNLSRVLYGSPNSDQGYAEASAPENLRVVQVWRSDASENDRRS